MATFFTGNPDPSPSKLGPMTRRSQWLQDGSLTRTGTTTPATPSALSIRPGQSLPPLQPTTARPFSYSTLSNPAPTMPSYSPSSSGVRLTQAEALFGPLPPGISLV